MLTTMVKSVRSVQYHLDDFMGEHPTTRTEKLRELFGISQPPPVPLIIDEREVVKMAEPTCPKCSSGKAILNGTNDKKVLRPYDEKGTLKRQQYICKICDNQYTTPFPDVRYHEHLPWSLKQLGTGVRTAFNESLRRAARLIAILTGYGMSHQTIWNTQQELAGDIGDTEDLSVKDSSREYCFDVQHVRINRKEAYRMTFLDAGTGDVLAEKVVSNLTYDEKSDFWKQVLDDEDVDVFITDGDTDVPDLIDEHRKRIAKRREVLPSEVVIGHQLCIFHAEKNLSKACRKAEASTGKDDPYPKDYKRPLRTIYTVFQLDNPVALEEHLVCLPRSYRERILQLREEGLSRGDLSWAARKIFDMVYDQRMAFHPRVRQKLEYMDRNWERLILFYRKNNPKTNNALESNYHATLFKTDKRKFRTMKGLEDYVRVQAWFRNRGKKNKAA